MRNAKEGSHEVVALVSSGYIATCFRNFQTQGYSSKECLST